MFWQGTKFEENYTLCWVRQNGIDYLIRIVDMILISTLRPALDIVGRIDTATI